MPDPECVKQLHNITREPAVIGYARSALADPSSQRQIDALVQFGVRPGDIFLDTTAGKNIQRLGWDSLWKKIRPSDLLIVYAIDRIGRNVLEIMRTIRDLREREVNLKVLNIPLDTRTPHGKLTYDVLATIAQHEQLLIQERALNGMWRAREHGRVGGAKPKWTNDEIETVLAKHNGGVLAAMRELGCSKATIIRRKREIEISHRLS